MPNDIRLLADIGARFARFAIERDVAGDTVRITNYRWEFSIEATRVAAGFDTLLVVNDFTALAMGLPYLAPHELRQVGVAPRWRSRSTTPRKWR
jgi:glucokinase